MYVPPHSSRTSKQVSVCCESVFLLRVVKDMGLEFNTNNVHRQYALTDSFCIGV